MPWKGFVAGAVTNLFGSGINAWSQHKANEANIAAQERINKANLDHANYWNTKNYELASEAQQAQLAQQQWANEQYIESRDYDRAMQQTVFNREDTAIQRAMQDATAAGFSPLAALGMPANAGQVISSSSSPGSMVSNNQASVQGAGQISPHVEAVTGLGDGLSSIGSMFATMAEGMSSREHQKQMQSADFAQRLLEMDKTFFADKVLKTMEHDFELTLEDQKYYYRIADALNNEKISARLKELDHKYALSLQNDAQSHQSEMQEDEQAHQLYMQGRQHVFDQSNANNKGGRGLHDVFNDIIDIVAQGDGKMAKWMRDNKDVLTLIVEGLEIGVGLGTGVANSASQRSVNQSVIDLNNRK